MSTEEENLMQSLNTHQRVVTQHVHPLLESWLPEADGDEQLQPPRHDDVVRFGGQVQPPLG